MVAVRTSDSIAAKVRTKVLKSKDRFWHVHDFDGQPKAVDMAMLRLADERELERVRRGIYWRGHKTRWGMTPPPPIAAVREVIGERESVGASGWSATNSVGISTQVPAVATVAITSRLPTGIPNVQLVSRAQRTGRREARLTDSESTFLEALEGWGTYSDVPPDVAVKRLISYMGQASVDASKLVKASPTEPVAVRERLKYLLGEAGMKVEADRIDGARSEGARRRALSVVRRSAAST